MMWWVWDSALMATTEGPDFDWGCGKWGKGLTLPPPHFCVLSCCPGTEIPIWYLYVSLGVDSSSWEVDWGQGNGTGKTVNTLYSDLGHGLMAVVKTGIISGDPFMAIFPKYLALPFAATETVLLWQELLWTRTLSSPFTLTGWMKKAYVTTS